MLVYTQVNEESEVEEANTQEEGVAVVAGASKKQDVSQKNSHIDDTVGMFYADSTVVQRLGTG